MTSRNYCPACQYPCSTCLCAHIRQIHCKTHLHILQDPKETEHAKNTARLLKLSLPTCRIWQGLGPDCFKELKPFLETHKHSTAVLYPSKSASIVHYKSDILPKRPKIDHLVLIDATWRRALKIWMLNPWLHSYHQVALEGFPSLYYVRKSKLKGSLSTLESAYHLLSSLEPKTDFSALIAALGARQQYLDGPKTDSDQ